MSINILSENLVSFHDLVSRVLPASGGKRVHIATPHRWRSHGLRGVRLEAIRVGGRWHTSLQSVQRFFDALSRVDGLPQQLPPPDRGTSADGTEGSRSALIALKEEGVAG
jgi:hypothetical protein